MSQFVVAITLDKVQNFLYQTFKSNTVEDQKEADTLQKVVRASKELSERFPNKIKEMFKDAGCAITQDDEIVFTSGKIIFYTRLSEDKIKECLQKLFRYYYLREIGQKGSKDNLKSKGQMRLNYTYFIGVNDKIEAIKIATDRLRLSKTMAKVVEDNAAVLFEFPCKSKIEIVEPLETSGKLRDGIFAGNIDELKKEIVTKESEVDDTDFFRIAVIKADLDGMGDLLKSIKEFSIYQNVSKTLNDFVHLDKFHELMLNQAKRKKDRKTNEYFKLLPLYIAGDDIFFIANVAHTFTAVDFLNRWLRLLNEELEQVLNKKLSLSIGIDVVAHSLPLRYMYDQVENQLNHAKEYKTNSGNVKMNISMYNQIFHIFKTTETQIFSDDPKRVKKEKDKKIKREIEQFKKDLKAEKKGFDFDNSWSKFRREVGLVQKGNSLKLSENKEDIIGFSYLYNLLEKSTMFQDKGAEAKYVNIILDQLVPDLEEKNHNNQVKNVLLNQLILEYNPDSKFKERKLMFSTPKYRGKFERKLRLFLLFSSVRYKVIIKESPENERDLKSSLILKPTRHLYKFIQSSEVAKLFIELKHSVKKDEYGNEEKDNRGKDIETDYYQRLPIKTSMFHRLKKFHDKGLDDKGAEAIFKVVKNIEEMKDENRKEDRSISKLNKGDREYDREFKEQQKVDFMRLAMDHKNWNEDIIDSLMILYKYIDVLEHWSKSKENGGNSDEGN